jgi:uncharacterized cupredoxin-like copper-binding protein
VREAFLLVTALLLLGACTQEDGGGFGDSPAATSAPEPTPVDLPVARPVQDVKVTAPGGARFEPSSLEMRASKLIEFRLVNEDSEDHTLVISELAVVMLAGAEQTVRSTLRVDRENRGTFAFFCSIPGHRESGMEGTIEVR